MRLQTEKTSALSAPVRRRNKVSNAVRDRIVLDHLPLVNERSVNLGCAGVLQECGTPFVGNGLSPRTNIGGFLWASVHRVYNSPFACTWFGEVLRGSGEHACSVPVDRVCPRFRRHPLQILRSVCYKSHYRERFRNQLDVGSVALARFLFPRLKKPAPHPREHPNTTPWKQKANDGIENGDKVGFQGRCFRSVNPRSR